MTQVPRSHTGDVTDLGLYGECSLSGLKGLCLPTLCKHVSTLPSGHSAACRELCRMGGPPLPWRGESEFLHTPCLPPTQTCAYRSPRPAPEPGRWGRARPPPPLPAVSRPHSVTSSGGVWGASSCLLLLQGCRGSSRPFVFPWKF